MKMTGIIAKTTIRQTPKNSRMVCGIIHVIETEGIGGKVQFPGEEEPHVIGPYQIRTFRKNENEYSECTLIETEA